MFLIHHVFLSLSKNHTKKKFKKKKKTYMNENGKFYLAIFSSLCLYLSVSIEHMPWLLVGPSMYLTLVIVALFPCFILGTDNLCH